MRPTVALLSLTLLLTGCSDPPDPERARSVLPESERLQTLYQQSCQGCHARPGTGAPLTAHPSQWAARLNKGMDRLVESVVRGYGAMPPGGQCLECDRSDHRALIRFMSGSGGDA
ncbi:cytochrome c5 [Tamilnaduibacter salinus]|uniref:Cytochrome c5 n=1 Tax=Tamilnaduibacter salinus TaxID=1484056 RepID=A0A2U1CY41_9GAMM|nr:c-type cytochrome [Tamilnaduibacter salinus]PVY77412.1 cytochrome c5 [Tamilnaduibacter salinus]